jgi:hypothetical protein
MGAMELNYDSMVKFMDEYMPVFSDFGQDPATVHRMNDYYAPDMEFLGYVGFPEPLGFSGRDEFLAFDVAHPSSYERLTALELSVDEKRKVVVAVQKFEFIDRKTGDVLVEERGVTQYHLGLDENGMIKIKKLLFFPQRLAPDTVSGTDIFFRDIPPR